MVGVITPLGTAQVIPDKSAVGGSVIIGTTSVILLTVAAGKKAKITNASFAGTSYGAGTWIELRINGVTMRRATVIEVNQINSLPSGAVVITAGQVVELIGDSAANNESAEYSITYQELPA